ncbi:unnamed protein product [Pleuronectes platessa]|uniref:Uncharacterized protein n=1 Tax=Pleuronectes platessa TaxID=8262 RepID=A0A9N7UH07_PLEPL|nr:unnamed protein product [Pleuronectes platessa]
MEDKGVKPLPRLLLSLEAKRQKKRRRVVRKIETRGNKERRHEKRMREKRSQEERSNAPHVMAPHRYTPGRSAAVHSERVAAAAAPGRYYGKYRSNGTADRFTERQVLGD